MKVLTNFLEEIIKDKRATLARAMDDRALSEVRESAFLTRDKSHHHELLASLFRSKKTAVIAEIKRASPSKGEIRPNIDAVETAQVYEQNGAAAISVLTEESFFRGSLDDLRQVKSAVSIPVLRKDFIFEPYQVYESAGAGADALLLIAATLDDDTLYDLRSLTEDELGMDALIEVHTAEEMRRAHRCKARLIGVNNRDLRTFEVSLDVSTELSRMAPPDAVLISESGLRTKEDLLRLGRLGYRGFLIGETLMRAEDPGRVLRELLAR